MCWHHRAPLGKGGFGKVLKVRKKDSGKIYAMKVMEKSLFKNEKHIEALMAERDIMLNDCVFLVHLYFSFQTGEWVRVRRLIARTRTEDKLYFVMDFVGGGDLAFYFDKFRKFPPDIVR
jgi:serum/glucocorticoid-regulated kinase 2